MRRIDLYKPSTDRPTASDIDLMVRARLIAPFQQLAISRRKAHRCSRGAQRAPGRALHPSMPRRLRPRRTAHRRKSLDSDAAWLDGLRTMLCATVNAHEVNSVPG